MGLKSKLAVAAGAIGLVYACSGKENPNNFCALDPDGQYVATKDGKNFVRLGAGWVEGTTGWSRKPVCILTQGSAPPEEIMPMKDFPHNGKVIRPEPQAF